MENNSYGMPENYDFNGSTYTYTDKESNITYEWDIEKNQWNPKINENENTGNNPSISAGIKNIKKKPLPKDDEEEVDTDDESEVKKPEAVKQDLSQGVYSYDGDTHIYTDPNDGTVYFWDKEKNAWFPKIDDTFIAYYQMNYGFTQSDETSDQVEKVEIAKAVENSNKEEKNSEKEQRSLKRKIEPEKPTWFELDDQHNTKVYVSNLPTDITETEFIDLMQKCGLVMKDLDTGKMKVKLYVDPLAKVLKGDALCTYIKKESVELALNLLDGYEVRGKKIKVEKAHFIMKGDSYDPSLKPKKKRKKDKEKLKKMQEKLFAWQPDKLRGERPKNERVVVIKNLFEPSMFDNNLGLIIEYREDIKEECSKCGAVKKVVIYDKHKDGVAQVFFKEADAADACIQLLNKRWFGQRLITAETWDGKTKYKVEETPEEAEARLKKWEEFLNSGKDGATDDYDAAEKKKETGENVPQETDFHSDDTRSSAGSGDETDEETNAK